MKRWEGDEEYEGAEEYKDHRLGRYFPLFGWVRGIARTGFSECIAGVPCDGYDQ
jgi:hypothetical protein